VTLIQHLELETVRARKGVSGPARRAKNDPVQMCRRPVPFRCPAACGSPICWVQGVAPASPDLHSLERALGVRQARCGRPGTRRRWREVVHARAARGKCPEQRNIDQQDAGGGALRSPSRMCGVCAG
jgi:hypothetical protein